MNQSLRLDFTLDGNPHTVVGFTATEGITFDKHPGVSPLNMGIGLQPRIPLLLDAVRRRHDWRNGEFKLDATTGGRGLVLSGFEGDSEGLPPGVYDLSVEVEALELKDPRTDVTIRSGKQSVKVFDIAPEKRTIKLRTGIDPITLGILEAQDSKVDGKAVMKWLDDPQPFSQRKACMLNVLAKMRSPQGKARAVLSRELRSIFWADVDRTYCVADPGLTKALEALVKSGEWVREGVPKARVHEQVVTVARQLGLEAPNEPMSLISYRQGGRNSLQIVVATPGHGGAAYIDADIDLGNPLWDLEGLIVHVGELLDPGRTDHLSLHKALDKNAETSDFVYYDVIKSA